MSAEEVLTAYHGLWKIEESFRVLKSNLETRPIYVWTVESIKGHLVVCYLALVIQRYLEYNLYQQGVELSTEKIQDAIRSATISLIEMDEQEFFIKNEPIEDFKDMVHALEWDDTPTYGKKPEAYIQP